MPEILVDRYATTFLKDPKRMKEDVKKYAKKFFGYDMSDDDYNTLSLRDKKAMGFLNGMPDSLRDAKAIEDAGDDLLALNLKPVKLRF